MIEAIMARRSIVGTWDAANRHDLTAFISGWRDGILVYPGDITASGTFEGKGAILA